MVNADPDAVRAWIEVDAEMRVGRTLKRTLYLTDDTVTGPGHDLCVGIVDSERLAAEIVKRWNQARWQRED